MLILRRSQGNPMGRPEERNCTNKENIDNVQVKKYKFIIILTDEFVLSNHPEHTVSPG